MYFWNKLNSMESYQYDYLKYWRVVRQFIKAKYGLTQSDLDILLFLYSEKYFGREDFAEYNTLLGWDPNRFNKLLEDGWIVVFRKRNSRARAIYEISYKTKTMIRSLYKKLNGEEIPVSPSSNPMFLKRVPYTDKVYRHYIKNMNADLRKIRQKNSEDSARNESND